MPALVRQSERRPGWQKSIRIAGSSNRDQAPAVLTPRHSVGGELRQSEQAPEVILARRRESPSKARARIIQANLNCMNAFLLRKFRSRLSRSRMQTLVIGHKNPDMDSICSAIGYAELKKATGAKNVRAARCGNTNQRIDYALAKFGFDSTPVRDERTAARRGCDESGRGERGTRGTRL